MNKKQKVLDYLTSNTTLFDDILFKEAAENSKFVEELLQVLLDEKGLVLLNHEVQKELNIYDSKSIRLDCYCKLLDGRIVNIEVERNDIGNKCNHVKRVRHYSSMITVKSLKKGESSDKLPELYMIYLTRKDFFKKGKTVYHIDRVIRECNEYNDNGLHEIYINAEVDDKSDISEVMKIMSTNDYINKNFCTISKVKEEMNMPVYMPPEIERLYKETLEESKAEGATQIIVNMYLNKQIGMDVALNNLNISEEEFLQKVKKYSK